MAVAIPSLLAGADGPIAFADVAAPLGVDFVHAGSPTSEKYLVETMTTLDRLPSWWNSQFISNDLEARSGQGE